jgi:hypothetical protein
VMNPIKVKYFEIILKNVPLHLEDHLRKKWKLVCRFSALY